MNWLLIVVSAIFMVGFIVGIFKGGIKIAVSLAATIVTLILVFFISPYVSKAIHNLTPVDESIEQKCKDAMSSFIASSSLKDQGIDEATIASLLEQYGISEKALNQAGITIDDILNGEVSNADLEKYGIPAGILNSNGSEAEAQEILENQNIPLQAQIAAIQNSNIPDIFKELLTENNNSEVYDALGVTTFPDYVAKYVSKLVIDIISFLITFIIITIILRAVIFALDIVTQLPVLGWINRLAGAAVGLVIALLVVDIILVGITLMFTTGVGKNMMALIDSSSFLTFLYDHNFIMGLVTKFR